jgi:hypothetical protein
MGLRSLPGMTTCRPSRNRFTRILPTPFPATERTTGLETSIKASARARRQATGRIEPRGKRQKQSTIELFA